MKWKQRQAMEYWLSQMAQDAERAECMEDKHMRNGDARKAAKAAEKQERIAASMGGFQDALRILGYKVEWSGQDYNEAHIKGEWE